MGHVAEGMLRAYADGALDAARRAAVDRHLAECGPCRDALAAVTSDASWASATLGGQAAPAPVATAEAWRRVAGMAGPAGPAGLAGRPAGVRPRAGWAVGVAAAAVVLAAAATPPVRAAAGDFLQVFRVQHVQVVTLSASDIAQIRSALAGGPGAAGVNIRGIASVQVVPPQAQAVTTTLAAAKQAVGFPLATPAGYGLTSATLQEGRVVRLTLHAAGINALLGSLGSSARVPASLDGKLVTLTLPASVRLDYPGFTVLETTTPQLAVPQGVDAAGLRQALLGLPFLPADVRSQLAGIQDWQNTLVLPEVSGTSQPVTVGGAQGVFVQAGSSGGRSALLWISGSVVRAVVGSLTQAQAQAIAAVMR